MLRYVVVTLSLLLLAMTLFAPDSNWPVDIYLFGYELQGNAFGWLFTAGLLLYLPLLLTTLFYLFHYAIGLFKKHDALAMLHLLLFALFPLIALIRFNSWVFSEIF